MEIKVRYKGSVVILDLCGRIDVNAAMLIETVGQCLRDGYSDILCNFESVEFIDYMGISVIVIAYKEAVNNNGRMKFSNILAHLKELFSVVGLDKVIDIYATEDAALSSFKEDKIIENIQKMPLRRRFKRLPLDIDIELKAKREGEYRKAKLLNISGVGMLIFIDRAYPLGELLDVRLSLKPVAESFQAEAKVAWLVDKKLQPQIYPGMGLEFYHLDRILQEQVLQFVERNSTLDSCL